MRHAGVVYPDPSPVIARGKKLSIGGKYVERGEKRFEGYITEDGEQHLDHITFPYQSGDVLLIAAEGQGANKIEPVLIYQMQGASSSWDTTLNGVGTSNLRIKTSNGYSPHLYPEYITDIEYYYAAAPRPGFMGRFIVGDSIVRAPYWPVSPNSFGGQIGASANGDVPGDIYRLHRRNRAAAGRAGADVRRVHLQRVPAPEGDQQQPRCGGGLRGSQRTARREGPLLPGRLPARHRPGGRQHVQAGGPDRSAAARLHHVRADLPGRPPAVGQRHRRQVRVVRGSRPSWPLDVPGVYRYRLRGTWNGYEGRMPGLPDDGGVFYVYSKTRPAGVAGLRVDGASQRSLSASAGTTITGTTTASRVHYALLTPGAVIEQGELTVGANGKFQYVFNPQAIHARVPLYDIVSITTGKPQIGRVIHLTFFAEERTAGGSFFDVTRVILRGTTALAGRPLLPAAPLPLVTAGGGSLTTGAGLQAAGSSQEASGDGLLAAPYGTAIAATDVATIRAWDVTLNRMLREGELVLTGREDDLVMPGRTHERLQQYHRGIPVFGGDVTRQIEGGVTVSIFGRLHLAITLGGGVAPAIGWSQAASIVERRTQGDVEPERPPALVVLPLEDGSCRLAWRAVSRAESDRRDCLVDAVSGEWLLDYSNLAARGTSGVGSLVRLIHRNESGALSEAISEVAATFTEFRAASPQGRTRAAAGSAGADTTADRRTARLADPARYGFADHYSMRQLGPGDDGGVHVNSTIAGHAFYLATQGGTNRTSGLSVEGAGGANRALLEKAFYRAFVHLLPSDATFALARAATLQAARDLEGDGGAVARALTQAWDAVGVR